MQVVLSGLSPEDPVFLPRGAAGRAQGDRGTGIFFLFTRKEDAGTNPEIFPAGEFAASVRPYDEVIVDREPEGVGARCTRDHDDHPGHTLWLDEWVPDAADTVSARLSRRDPQNLPTVPRVDRVLGTVARAHSGRIFTAIWLRENGNTRATALFVVVPVREVDIVAEQLEAGFLKTPHPPVLVGSRREFPLGTRRRMLFAR